MESSADSKDKVMEPTKVVILPDASIRGTDRKNMQIKELQSKSSKGVWLAVHIPDNATVPRPVKIMSTKKAADDLEKVVGPNKETMFKELQTIIGVDSQTLRKMLKAGQVDNNRQMRRKRPHYDDDDYDDEEQNDDEEDDNEDDDDDDDYSDDYSGEEQDDECDDDDEYVDDGEGSGKTAKGKCSKLLPWTVNGGRGSGALNDEIPPSVFQPNGFKKPLADLLNKMHFKYKKKKVCFHASHPLIKELCKEMSAENGHRYNPNHPRRHHTRYHNKYYKHLKHLMSKFLDRHNGAQAKKVLEYMNLLLSDQLRLSSDGVVHLYPNRGKPNSYRDGFNALVQDDITAGRNADELEDRLAGLTQGGAPQGPIPPGIGLPLMDQPQMDDSQDGHVIRIPVQAASARGGIRKHRHFGIISPLQANILNNQVHTKLGDIHSADDLQMQSFKEELGKYAIRAD